MSEITTAMTKQIEDVLDRMLKYEALRLPEWLQPLVIEAKKQVVSDVKAEQAVITRGLEELQKRNLVYAAVLENRYWQRREIPDICKDKSLPRINGASTFYDYRKKAIPQLTEELWQQVEDYQQQMLRTHVSPPNPILEPRQLKEERGTYETIPFPRHNRSGWMRFSVIYLLGAMLFGATTIGAVYGPKLLKLLRASSIICGDAKPLAEANNLHVSSEIVHSYNVANTKGGVLFNVVRAIAVDQRGVWLGYFPTSTTLPSSVSFYNGHAWAKCYQEAPTASSNVNAVLVDADGVVWVATEHEGVLRIDQDGYRAFTVDDGLPSNQAYGLALASDNSVWVATWLGVAQFQTNRFVVPLILPADAPGEQHVHAITFDGSENVWIGYIDGGISVYNFGTQHWQHYTTENSGLGSNKIREMKVQQVSEKVQAIWIATGGGGVTKVQGTTWTVYNESNGLPANDVPALAIDRYSRIWAGTAKGTAYFDHKKWYPYTSFPTGSIAFGPKCTQCPFDDNHVWTATSIEGVTHSLLPAP